MSITFYAAKFSSALPVACALHELGVAHERVEIDFASGALRTPEFLALNPNGKVPTLVVDGTPMFEALAITCWLGDRYGVSQGLWPSADAPARLTALSWCTWGYVTFGAHLQRFGLASSDRAPAELRSPAHAEHAHAELQALLGLLDARLAQHGHVLGKEFSLADLLLANVMRYAGIAGVALESHAQVGSWLERCNARPSMRAEWG